jgi:hypothetical protein
MRLIFLLFLFTTHLGLHSADGLQGKVMCGYQGWFRTPDDGTNTNWHHYANGKTFEPSTCSIEMWPDVRELPAADRTATPFRHPDGSPAEVYSSTKPSAVSLHFQWMRDYGIDGVFLQRFATTTRDPRFRAPMDKILELTRAAAKEAGRRWVLMYDLTGLKPGRIDTVIEDWKRLQDQYRLTDAKANPAYLRHRGKPLVALWGLGFSDREPMLDEWQKLIAFLKDDPTYGGCSIKVGVPTFWRILKRDAITDPKLHEILATVDVISPWTVGRYNSPANVAKYVRETMTGDLEWCRERNIDYIPVAFPGFSWHNLQKRRGKDAPLNAIPRLGGKFLWSQFREFQKAGVQMQYVAMFDEVDEGTAIFKIRQDPPSTPETPFASEPDVPGDQYLWLTGQAGRLLRKELTPASDELPVRTK